MPIFKRHSSEVSPPSAGPAFDASLFALPEGTEPCLESTCKRPLGVRCNYIDRRDNPCQTAWCPEHWMLVRGVVYCRRHAGTIRALGEWAKDPLALPDIDNRGPSLVNWISRDLDADLRTLLEGVAVPPERFSRETVVTVVHDRNRERRWERSWKLIAHTGVVLKVAVEVLEDDDALVYVRVNADIAAKGVPPWIERRRRREPDVFPQVDIAQRTLFYGFLIEHIAYSLTRQRLGPHMTRPGT